MNANDPKERIRGRRLPWIAGILFSAGIFGMISVLGRGDAAFILNHRFLLEASASCLAASVIVLIAAVKAYLPRALIADPAFTPGLAVGMLFSLGLILSKAGWLFVVLLPVGGLFASRSLVRRSSQIVTRRQGAACGRKAGLIGSVVALFIGLPGALVSQRIFWNAYLEWAARNVPDVPGALAPHRFVADYALGWLVISVLAIGLDGIMGRIGVGLFQRRRGESGSPRGPRPGESQAVESSEATRPVMPQDINPPKP